MYGWLEEVVRPASTCSCRMRECALSFGCSSWPDGLCRSVDMRFTAYTEENVEDAALLEPL